MDYIKDIKPGMLFKNHDGEQYEVVKPYGMVDGKQHFIIKFENPVSWQVVPSKAIGRPHLSNRATKRTYNVGYMSSTESRPLLFDEQAKKILARWRGMLARCYSETLQRKRQTYLGTIVCEEWHDFTRFLEWARPFSHLINIGWDLDKDLMGEGRNLYSPETCVFLPVKINSALAKRRLWKQDMNVSGSAKMMYLFSEEIEEEKDRIPSAAYGKLRKIVEDFKELYETQTGKSFEKLGTSAKQSPKKVKRGRPRTVYKIPFTFRITQEAADMIAGITAKSEYIDELIKKANK